MRYAIRHRTTFDYEQRVSVSHHVLHLVPRGHDRQVCLTRALDIDPAPSLLTAGEDYYGNPTHYMTVSEPHDRLVVEARAEVELEAPAPLEKRGWGEPWESVAALLGAPRTPAAVMASDFVYESPYIGGSDAVRTYALESFAPGRQLLDAAFDLTHRIYADFEYQGGVSDVSTPVADVLAMRKGVCQDFAHLAIAAVRSLGLAARYVSGYLLTHPPEGSPKLVGADASHAWLAVWSPTLGWIDFDPTNDLVPSIEHITLGWGRDYGDVSPINGFILGGGTHELRVAVDVEPRAELPA